MPIQEGDMKERQELIFWDHASEILRWMSTRGVLCTVVDGEGQQNVLTLGWGLIGPNYEGRPIFVIAVSPLRYSWIFLEDVPEFVIAIPDDSLADALDFCGAESGYDFDDKFGAAGLTPVASVHVRAPSILECPINVECSIYTRVAPPHLLLTPRHRERPIEEQHTIYFAQVMGIYRWKPE